MGFLRQKLTATPIHARLVPYVLIVFCTFFQDSLPGEGRFWAYLAKILVGAWCIWVVLPHVGEIKWAISWEAVAAGVLVFVIWVGLDPFYPKLEFLFKSSGEPWNPVKHFGEGSFMAMFFVAVRTVGSAVVVPPIEEAFYRSFLYRYFIRTKFKEVPFHRLHWLSLVVTSTLFGLVHYQWLAGILCGLCYQALVIRKNRLGDAMTAHAITNFLLGVYIWVWGGDAWRFW